MAGLWIQWVKGLADRSEVLMVSRNLGVDRRIVATCCMLFWEWADDNTTDGYIRGCDAGFIDEKVGLPGFARELEAASWIRMTNEGVTIANFDHHNGDTAKARAMDARRKALDRAKRKAEEAQMRELRELAAKQALERQQEELSGFCPDIIRNLSGKCPENVRPKEEKRIEEESKAHTARARAELSTIYPQKPDTEEIHHPPPEPPAPARHGRNYLPGLTEHPRIAAILAMPGFQAFDRDYPPHRRCAPRVAATMFAGFDPVPDFDVVNAGLARRLASDQWTKSNGDFVDGMAKFIECRMWEAGQAAGGPAPRLRWCSCGTKLNEFEIGTLCRDCRPKLAV